MKIMLKNPTQPNPPLIYLIIFVSLISLFSLSCSKNKINGLEKYNGNVYVSVTPEITGGGTEWTPWYYYYYRWLYIEDGRVYSEMVEGNTRKPQFEIWRYDHLGNKMGYNDIWFKGSGNSYSYEDKSYNYNPDNDENIPLYNIYKVTLEFSEDGKSIAYNSIESGHYWHDYGTRTVNLTLTLFKETGTTEEPEPPEVIPPEIIDHNDEYGN